VPFSNSKLTRDEVLSRFFPLSPVAGLGQNGLSGGSCIISDGVRRLVLRQPHDPTPPLIFSASTAPCLPAEDRRPPAFYSPGWLVVEYCDGEMKSTLPECPQLAGLLYHLHRQPRLGWRVALAPLLERYWLACDPARRTPRGCVGINVCCSAASLVLCGWRRYIWMSMPAILSIRKRPAADRLGICGRWRYCAGAGRGVDAPASAVSWSPHMPGGRH
jgi:hypothetical protein